MTDEERQVILERIKKAESLPPEKLEKYRLNYDLLKAQIKAADGYKANLRDITLITTIFLLGLRTSYNIDEALENLIYKAFNDVFNGNESYGILVLNACIDEAAHRKIERAIEI